MNKLLLLGFSVLLFYAVAEGLICKVCKYKLGNLCVGSTDPCQADEGQYCETSSMYAGRLWIRTQSDCGKYAELCNKTEERNNFFGTRYERTCCNSDLCNS